MKPSLAVSLLSPLVSAAIIPAPANRDASSGNIVSVAGTSGPDLVSINFRAPCDGCFTGADDGLNITLEIDTADTECGGTPPRLNGHPLGLTNESGVARGDISIETQSTNGLTEKEVHATWESTCLKGEASIITVRFTGVSSDGEARAPSGFTTSFKQKGQPTVLRLQDKPMEELVAGKICDEWLLPSDLTVIPPATDTKEALETLLEAEYLRLDRLRDQMSELHDSLRATETRIMSLLKAEFKACSSMKCLWQTAIDKVPTVAKLITSHFSQHKHHGSGCKAGEAQTACSSEADDQTLQDVAGDLDELGDSVTEVEDHEIPNLPTRSASASDTRSTASIVSPLPTPTATRPALDSEPTLSGTDDVHTPSNTNASPTPAATTSTSQMQENPAPAAAPPFDGPGKGFPHRPGHHGPPPWGFGPPGRHGPPGNHQNPPHPEGADVASTIQSHAQPGLSLSWPQWAQRTDFRVTLAIALLLVVVILGGLTFCCIRIRTFLRDPRRRAECAARREERITRRLYRKAACHHKWRTWWKRFQPSRTGDYEEKRVMILEQEGILEDVMRNQIRSLQNATTFVRDLVRIEEGRARLVNDRAMSTPYSQRLTAAELEAGVGSSRRPDVLPSYVAPPPRYDEELEGDMMIVDGFQYPPSTSDDTTESSIVDCTPRLSFETGRSTILTEKGRD